MIWIALGCVALGLLLGGAGMRRVGRLAGRAWRPGAGMLALAAFIGAGVLAARHAYPPALGLALVAIWLAMSARRIRRAPRSGAVAGPALDVHAAAQILGVAPDATEQEVQEAYLRLIRRAHPDQGGTTGLAAQLNAARDTMMRRAKG